MIELDAGTVRRRRSRRRGRSAAVGISLALLVALLGAYVLARAVMLRGTILPGVTVAGLEVGGLERTQARAKLEAVLGSRLARPIAVSVGDESFSLRPDGLFELDAAASAELAYDVPRRSLFSRFRALVVPFAGGHEVEPVLRLRTRGVDALAAELHARTRRPVSARVTMDGTTPVVASGRYGTRVDETALAESLRLAALSGSPGTIAKLLPQPPPVTTDEARRAASRAKVVVSAPVSIRFRGDEVGVLTPRMLAQLLRFEPAAGGYRLVLAREALDRVTTAMIASRTKKRVDASFEVIGTRVRVVPGRAGTKLAAKRAARSVLRAARKENAPRVATVGLVTSAPELTTREARQLGIREQISTFTTDMGPSSSNRIHNVHLLGQYLDGTILEPGEKFSFNRVLGPRTPERGFLEGQMIFGGLLLPSIGGGVCQTATTIFNTAFEAGLPVKEQHNHSFYISHYPVGRDATVSWGGPDLVFRNDLKHGILIKATWTDATFTVTFYGTGQERRVEATTSEPSNYTQPSLQYAVDPSAPPRSLRRTDPGGPGFDVNVHRKVFERGKLIREDDFFTRYTPEHATAIYGPGRTPPGPYFTLPTS